MTTISCRLPFVHAAVGRRRRRLIYVYVLVDGWAYTGKLNSGCYATAQ